MERYKRVLLVVPPARGDYGRPGYPHVGLAYVGAALHKGGFEVNILDMRLDTDVSHLDDAISRHKPDLVGVTTYTLEYQKSYDIIRHVKGKTKAPVVAGGPHASVICGRILEETEADYAIVGEGERAIVRLCEGAALEGIENLIFRKGAKVMANPRAPPIRDLDTLPYPEYGLFPLERYDNKQIPIVSSRGCPYQCVYCSIKLTMTNIWRPRSPENVVGEIEYWHNRGYRDFQFTDDNFTLDAQRTRRICDLIIERNLAIRWDLRNGVRVDRIDAELLTRMKAAGCFFVAFGIESGNQRILDAMKKGITLEQVTSAVRAAKSAGLKTSGFFIIGTPEETFETAMDSIRFADTLPLDETRFYNAIPYPGTEFYDWVLSHGKFVTEAATYLNSMSHQRATPVFETKEFPLDRRIEALKRASAYTSKRNFQVRFGILAPLACMLSGNESLKSQGRRILSLARKFKAHIGR
jgi:anaerobic magnesium-protoporphyrin IX monomethyl ester cyclase